MPEQVYCPIHHEWSNLLRDAIIPPDVLARFAECGHALPMTVEARETPEVQPVENTLPEPITPTEPTEPEPEPEPFWELD